MANQCPFTDIFESQNDKMVALKEALKHVLYLVGGLGAKTWTIQFTWKRGKKINK